MPAKPRTFQQRFAHFMHIVPGGALLFALIPLVVLGYLGWYHYGSKKLDQALYALRLEQVQLTQQPHWIMTSVLEEVYKASRLDRINILDPAASSSIASAFETHPWVEKTTRVQKVQGRGVSVDVIYRKPLAMVQVYYYPTDESGMRLSERKEGYYPVDHKGVVLPVGDFKQTQAMVWDYPIIDIDDLEQAAAQPGMPFKDVRIQEGLRLIAFLEKQSEIKKLGVQWIRVRRDNNLTSASPWILEIWTTDQRMITWGRSPGEEAAGESTAERKIAVLSAWLESQRSRGTSNNSLNLLDPRANTASASL